MLPLDYLEPGKPSAITILGKELVVWRDGDIKSGTGVHGVCVQGAGGMEAFGAGQVCVGCVFRELGVWRDGVTQRAG